MRPTVPVVLAISLFFARAAEAACNPCSVNYLLTVLHNGQQPAILSGTAQISDGTLDLNLGSVQSLLGAQVGSGATLTSVTSLVINGSSAAAGNDVLLAQTPQVVGWVDAPNGNTGHLHLGTVLTQSQPHPFSYAFSARGTEGPPVNFQYTITATGQETYRAPAHKEQTISIPYYNPGQAECREISGTVCFDSSRCVLQSSRTDEYIGTGKTYTQLGPAGNCYQYNVKVSSTDQRIPFVNNGENCEGTGTGCGACGAEYKAIIVLDGYCEAERTWSRSISGAGQVEANPSTKFTLNYASAGGPLGSGQPDAVGLFGTPSYSVALSNCTVGGSSIPCSNLGTSISGNVLTVSTVYKQDVFTAKNGNASLNATQGTVLLDSLPFSSENNDMRHFVDVTFQGRLYQDVDANGFVDVGPFSVWVSGANNDELYGAFSRGSIPVATIDSITPANSVFGQNVSFTGHGTGPFTTYHWFTHRLDQTGGTQLGTTPAFGRSDLHPGGHQIRFFVRGLSDSPSVYASINVNQPPVAFVNHIENVNDPAHPLVSLLLRDGAQTDAFDFHGGGIDIDGVITAYEWKSSLEGTIGTTAHFQKALTILGTHTISFRVQDNAGEWSSPVQTVVVVRRPPLLLVHGQCGAVDSWNDVMNNGWLGPQWPNSDIVRRTFDPNGDNNTDEGPWDIAPLIEQEIQSIKQQFGVRMVNLLVHSYGGINSRTYIQGPGYRGDVNKLVMLATPNHGSTGADIVTMTNGFSAADVGLFIPSPRIQVMLVGLGLVVDVISAFAPNSFISCVGNNSQSLQVLRPHSVFLRTLNQTHKDDGTEDFGPSGQPADAVSPQVEYFGIHGTRTTISHLHIPQTVIDAIRIATLDTVDLTGLSLLSLRDGDRVVTQGSVRLDGMPMAGFHRGHMELREVEPPVRKAQFYLLDDPPPPPPPQDPLSGILTAHPLGARRGHVGDPAAVIEVDTAAVRLRVSLSWLRDGRVDVLQRAPTPVVLVLTSPSGVRFDSAAARPGFSVDVADGSIDVVIENVEAGTWTLEVVKGRLTKATVREYGWVAFEETGTFVAVGTSAERVDPGQTVTLAAYVQQGGAGKTGAVVNAAVSDGDRKPVVIPMKADARFPGLYTGQFVPATAGMHRVLVAADIFAPKTQPLSRVGFANVEVRVLPDLSISMTVSKPAPAHGESIRLNARVVNRGKIPVTLIPVRFFDGLPSEGGKMIGEKVVNVPAAAVTIAAVSVPMDWIATAGVHTLVAVIDPVNRSGELELSDNIAKLAMKVTDTVRPIARAGVDQFAGVGQGIVLDGRASTDDDRIVSYRWTLTTPQPLPPSQTVSAARFSAPRLPLDGGYVAIPGGFPLPGSYTVRLTVTDASGNTGTDDLLVRVRDGSDAAFDTTPPIANAGPDQITGANMPIRFDGMASRDNSGVALATWDVDLARDSDGDGNSANDRDLAGLSPTLTRGYAKTGIYRVRLTIRDAVGNGPATDDMQVTVTVGTGTTPRTTDHQ